MKYNNLMLNQIMILTNFNQKFKNKLSNIINIKFFLQIGLSAFWAVILTGTFIKFF